MNIIKIEDCNKDKLLIQPWKTPPKIPKILPWYQHTVTHDSEQDLKLVGHSRGV